VVGDYGFACFYALNGWFTSFLGWIVGRFYSHAIPHLWAPSFFCDEYFARMVETQNVDLELVIEGIRLLCYKGNETWLVSTMSMNLSF